MTNASGFSPQVYYRIFQFVSVKPNTKYIVGAWLKGKSVGRCWIGGGEGWWLKTSLPAGDFNWRWVSTEYTTKANETRFELILLTEGTTQALWIDDVYMAEADGTGLGEIYAPTVHDGVRAESRFYPAFCENEKKYAPVVKVRSAEDSRLGFDAKITYDAENLIFNVDVIDPTVSGVIPGKDMWYSDSIQIGLDTQPERAKDGYGASCYEINVGYDQAEGKVIQYAVTAGGTDLLYWKDLEARGWKTQRGYGVEVHFPWKRMRLAEAGLPKVLGINILVNDGQGNNKGRRWAEWTYGIGFIKTPDRFTRVILVKEGQYSAGYFLFDRKAVYDRKDFIIGRYVEYAGKGRPAEKVKVVCEGADGKANLTWGEVKLPAVSAGSSREFGFLLPAKSLTKEGRFSVVGEGDGGRISA
jgi:hypothetical protein